MTDLQGNQPRRLPLLLPLRRLLGLELCLAFYVLFVWEERLFGAAETDLGHLTASSIVHISLAQLVIFPLAKLILLHFLRKCS